MRTREHASPVTTASQTGLTFILILSGLMAFTSLSTDIYLPAMPTMAEDLHGNVELTITGFLIGFTIAQLIWGPISDHMGRRKPLFIGMVLFIIGSAGCALSTSITQIVFWRVFQALGACTGPMLARAMIRDLFARTRAAQMLSTLVLVMAIAPIAGPLIGGQIIRLMRYTLSLTFYYVGAYAFITGSPFVYISYYHVDPQHYGWLFALNIIGVMAMSVVNRRLVQRHALEQLLKYATLLAALAAVVLALLVKLESGGVVAIIITVFLFFSMNGIIAATSTAAALDAVPNIAGSASALIGALQYGSGIISSLLLAAFSDGTPWTMAWIIALFTLLSAVLAFRAKR